MGCAKGISILGAAIIMAVGLAGIAVSIYLFVQNQLWTQVIGNYQLTFAILFIVISCVITLTGAFGLFGTCNDNKCLLHIFWILLAVWTCGFIAAGIIAVVLPEKVLSEGCTSPTLNNFTNLNNLSNTAVDSSDFCKNGGCQCYIASPTTAAQAALLFFMTNVSLADSTKAKNVNDCPNWGSTAADSVMAGLQKAFQCSGWCNRLVNPVVFYFSDNSDSSRAPTNTCFNAFADFFAKYGRYVYITSFVLAGVCLILVISTIIYICLIGEFSK